MPKPMFVISASGGSYDDAWERAEFVTDDFDKGTAYVEKMNALSDAVESANIQFSNWQQHYLIDNPRRGQLPYIKLPIPKWKSSDKVTKEMRDERKRIEDLNNAALQVANKPMNDHARAMHDAGLAYKATLPEEIQRGMENVYSDTRWDIEPINWLE